jgi:hypothetical protein
VWFPLTWTDLDQITPADFTVHTAIGALAGGDPWAESMPAPHRLPEDLIEHGRTVPVARPRPPGRRKLIGGRNETAQPKLQPGLGASSASGLPTGST